MCWHPKIHSNDITFITPYRIKTNTNISHCQCVLSEQIISQQTFSNKVGIQTHFHYRNDSKTAHSQVWFAIGFLSSPLKENFLQIRSDLWNMSGLKKGIKKHCANLRKKKL